MFFCFFSFTWTASRLDSSIITVLTGQAVDLFDQLFQDLYIMSNAVNLNKINLEKEQKLEPILKMTPALQPSATMALKLINPKYSLVSGNAAANSNHVDLEICTAKSNSMKQMKEVPESPHIHPGLLHLEKANMIDYLPVWPEPDPSSDVIGFINIRDYNKPIQAHFTRSELFEVSQAIRFKEPIHMPTESLAEKICLIPTLTTAFSVNEDPVMQPKCIPEENNKHCNPCQQIHPPYCLEEHVECQSPIPNTKTAHSCMNNEKDSPVDHDMGKQTDILSKQGEETDIENIIDNTTSESCKDSQISDIHNITPFYSVGYNTGISLNSVAEPETISNKQNWENIPETMSINIKQDDQWNAYKLTEPDTNKTGHIDCTIQNGESICSDFSSSFSSEEYFECGESVIFDPEIIDVVESSTAVESLSSLMSGLCKNTSCHEPQASIHQSVSPEECNDQQLAGVTTNKSYDLGLKSMNGGNGPSANKQAIQETDSISQQGTESNLVQQIKTGAQVVADENTECLQECESCTIVNHTFEVQPVERTNSVESQLLVNEPLLQHEVSASYVPVQKNAEAQCIVFSDPVNKTPLLILNPYTCSELNYTPNLKSVLEVNDDTHSAPQSKPASLNNSFQKDPYTQRSCEEACILPFQIKPLIAEESDHEQAGVDKDKESCYSELKERATAQLAGKAQQVHLKTVTGLKIEQFSVDIYPLKRKTLENKSVRQENINQPERKPKIEKNVKKVRLLFHFIAVCTVYS